MARLRRLDERLTEPWTAENDLHLISLLKDGKRPPEIAPIMERTVGALWRRINKLGGIGRLIGKPHSSIPAFSVANEQQGSKADWGREGV